MCLYSVYVQLSEHPMYWLTGIRLLGEITVSNFPPSIVLIKINIKFANNKRLVEMEKKSLINIIYK